MRKRYEILYTLFDRKGTVVKEKVLKQTNSKIIATRYFKNRVGIFKRYVFNNYVEVLVYDYLNHCAIARCQYFIY